MENISFPVYFICQGKQNLLDKSLPGAILAVTGNVYTAEFKKPEGV
jgi:hypothetical protein